MLLGRFVVGKADKNEYKLQLFLDCMPICSMFRVVGAGKQGGELEAGIAGLVGVEDVAVVAVDLPSILVVGV